jgi:hypothetical protein
MIAFLYIQVSFRRTHWIDFNFALAAKRSVGKDDVDICQACETHDQPVRLAGG